MRIVIDIDSNQTVLSPSNLQAAGGYSFKRADSARIEVQFAQAGVAIELATGATGKFMLKESGKFNSDPIVSDTTWAKEGTGTSTLYVFEPSFNTEELNDLLVDGDIAETAADQTARYALTGLELGDIVKQSDDFTYWAVKDVAGLDNAAGWEPAPLKESVTLIGEVERVVSGARASSNTFTATVYSDVIRGDEGVPTSGPPDYPSSSEVFAIFPAVTGLTGGGATNLDGQLTAGGIMVEKSVRAVVISSALKLYQFTAGTDAESAPGIVRPDDFDETTNAYVWKQIL